MSRTRQRLIGIIPIDRNDNWEFDATSIGTAANASDSVVAAGNGKHGCSRGGPGIKVVDGAKAVSERKRAFGGGQNSTLKKAVREQRRGSRLVIQYFV